MSARLPVPERVGRYEILLPIARGGMATVYLARAVAVGGFEREVALKLVHPHIADDPDRAVEFLEEAKLGARLRHPNVVPVLDVGEDPFGTYLVMEYVECMTVAGLLRAATEEGPLPIPMVVRILSDALSGLHAAHELCDDDGGLVGLVHRDFTPQNVLVGIDGISRLADFGVARATTRVALTQTGVIKGKVRYMAPEQARAQPLDRRCDVLAAGVVAWELFAGRSLYDTSEDDVAVLMRVVTEEPPSVRRARPELPRELADALAAALARDVRKRPPTAEALRQRIVEACEPLGPMADALAVGRRVAALVGPELAERRAKVATIRKRRADARLLEPGSATASQEALDTSTRATARELAVPGLDPPTQPSTSRTRGRHLLLAAAAGATIVAGAAVMAGGPDASDAPTPEAAATAAAALPVVEASPPAHDPATSALPETTAAPSAARPGSASGRSAGAAVPQPAKPAPASRAQPASSDVRRLAPSPYEK